MAANTPIFSCAIISALYGILIRIINDDKTEHWNTQCAADIRPIGICILFCKNHNPIVSDNNSTRIATKKWKYILVENTLLKYVESLEPIPYVIYLWVADDNESLITLNIATIQPTTLYIP